MIEQELLRSLRRSLSDASLTACDRLIVAFSGGLDSTVLVDLLHKNYQLGGPTPELVHVDHSAREDSRADAHFCKEQARQRGLPFHLITLKPAPKRGQTSFRRQRLAALARQAIQRGAPAIALGHHAHDRFETFLLNSLRGAGLRGLSGMRELDPFPLPSSTLHLLRPLIEAPLQDLMSYAQKQNLPWIEDPSNQLVDYTRNRLRHQVMSHLLNDNHDRLGLLQTLNNIDSEADAMLAHAQALLDSARQPAVGPHTVSLNRSILASSPAATLAHLFLTLEPSLNAQALQEIRAAICASPTWKTTHLTKSRCLITITRQDVHFEPAHSRGAKDLLDRGALPVRLLPHAQGEAPFLGTKLRWQTIPNRQALKSLPACPPQNHMVLLDDAELSLPLQISGPPPQGSHAELDHIFSHHRTPPHIRWRWPCLYDNDHHLIWAPGLPPPQDTPNTAAHPPNWLLCLEPHFDIIRNLQPQRN